LFYNLFYEFRVLYVWTENTSAQIAFGDSPRSLKKDYDPASVDRRWLVSANWFAFGDSPPGGDYGLATVRLRSIVSG
jgi:hypothetical protein